MTINSMKKRLEKLAKNQGMNGRMIVFEGPVSEATDEQLEAILAKHGIDSSSNDQLVQLLRFSNQEDTSLKLRCITDDSGSRDMRTKSDRDYIITQAEKRIRNRVLSDIREGKIDGYKHNETQNR